MVLRMAASSWPRRWGAGAKKTVRRAEITEPAPTTSPPKVIAVSPAIRKLRGTGSKCPFFRAAGVYEAAYLFGLIRQDFAFASLCRLWVQTPSALKTRG